MDWNENYSDKKWASLCNHIPIIKTNRKLDLLNYATRSDLKIKTGVNTSEFAKRSDLGSLKLGIDKLGN